jgi:hypothetical protein
VVTISANDMRPGMSIVEHVARNVDRAVVERAERDLTAQATAERIAFLYSRLFGNVAVGGDVARLRTENEASTMLRRAVASADNLLQVKILRLALDNRWATVVNAFIKVWDEHPISDTVQELWALITGRGTA